MDDCVNKINEVILDVFDNVSVVEKVIVSVVGNIFEVEVLINWLCVLFDEVERLLLNKGVRVLNEVK